MTQFRIPATRFAPFSRPQTGSQGLGVLLWDQRRRLKRWLPWSLGSLLVSLNWASDWPLVLATGVGVVSVKFIYPLLNRSTVGQRPDWQQWLEGPQRQLVLAGGASGMAVVVTYLLAKVWLEADAPWFVTTLVLQGLVSCALLALLVHHHTCSPRFPTALPNKVLAPHSVGLEAALHNLAHGNPLQKRLALRQIRQWVQQFPLPPPDVNELLEFLQVFCELETDPRLQRLAIAICQSLAAQTAPLQIPQAHKQRQVVRQY